MCKIATWSVVNNEISFIKNLLDFHLQWVDVMYFLDTGSQDGTLEILKYYANNDSRVIVEEYPIKYIPQYELSWHEMSDPFPEVTIRNHAIKYMKNINCDWIIQLDGDEIFIPATREIINKNKNYMCIGHSTINPVCDLQEHPIEYRGDCTLYDPHVRIWKNNQNIFYMENPSFRGHQYHCIPIFDETNTHLFHHPLIKFINEPMHFHLHWMYGKKLENFYNKKNVYDRQIMIDDHKIHEYSNVLPAIFWEKQQEWLKG